MNPLALPSAEQYVLDAIAQGESGGDYQVIYGGERAPNLMAHPNVRVPLGDGRYSSAAGKYQFTKPTWDLEVNRLGLKDFSPSSQDLAAWDLAQRTYQEATGRSLANDAAERNVDWSALEGQWTSLKRLRDGGQAGEAKEAEAPDTTTAPPAAAESPRLGLDQLLQIFHRSFKFTPVEYDPFAVEEKMIGGAGGQ